MDYMRIVMLAVLLPGVAAAIDGCGSKSSRQTEPTCEPTCSGRCEGDDGCGGSCECTASGDTKNCGGACAPHETCIAEQCVCEPDCQGRACLADGCGGRCACPEDMVQNSDGDWVSQDDCTDDCSSAGWQCGAVCGQTCGGACDEGLECELGQCHADFCSQTACNPDVTCADCALSLRLLEKKVENGRLLEATLALEFTPRENAPLPRIADFRIDSNQDVQLLSLEPGEASEQAGKSFFVDPGTNKTWRRRADGTFQAMLFSAGNTTDIRAGRLATLRFAVGSKMGAAFRLVRRVETMAPPLADSELQASKYDQGLMVVP